MRVRADEWNHGVKVPEEGRKLAGGHSQGTGNTGRAESITMSKRTVVSSGLKALAVLVVPVLLYFVLKSIGFRQILQAMKQTGGASIGAAFFLYLAVFVLCAFRCQWLMKCEERGSMMAMFPIHMAGTFGNLMTPGARVGGEPIRAYYMSRAFGGEKTAHLGTVLAGQFGSTFVFFIFLVLSAIFVVLFVPLAFPIKALLASAIILVGAAVLSGLLLSRHIMDGSPLASRLLRALYESHLLGLIRRRFHTYELFEEYTIRKLANVSGPVVKAAVSPKAVGTIFGIGFTSWMLRYLAYYILFRGMGANIGFHSVIVIVTVSIFLGDISFSPGGAGFTESAMIALCAAFGIDYSAAAAVTLISRGIFYLYGLGVGGLCLAGLACIYGRRERSA